MVGVKPSLKKNANPLQAGIYNFLSSQPDFPEGHLKQNDVPKRYTLYGSLLLLGPTFAHHSPTWRDTYAALTEDAKLGMFASILKQFPGRAVTHIAMNAPILPNTDSVLVDETRETSENVMRSPIGLLPLYGDFGPPQLQGNESELAHFGPKGSQPSSVDFEQAYWTEVSQLQNIAQVWAPRWTMFSRGNISEKARILQDGTNVSPFPGLTESELSVHPRDTDVVDFYVGIGYFTFCYLSRGVKRVWGWDINGWSIEGLRRGCIKNGWGVKVVKVNDGGEIVEPASANCLVDEIESLEGTAEAIRCIAFWGDNRWAHKVMQELSAIMLSREKSSMRLSVRHCNLGLLPTSRGSWQGAFDVIDAGRGGWLHVHDNVDVKDIDNRKDEIVLEFQRITSTSTNRAWTVLCDHIEKVKTYAPGVMHCVYDIRLLPPS